MNLASLVPFIDSLTNFAIAIAILLQFGIVYLLPPEKAEKFNFLGQILQKLAKTKAGLTNENHDRETH